MAGVCSPEFSGVWDIEGGRLLLAPVRGFVCFVLIGLLTDLQMEQSQTTPEGRSEAGGRIDALSVNC